MAAELLSQGNDAFVNENYQKALELYTDAVKTDEGSEDALCHRAQACIKLSKYEDAVADCEKAIKIKKNCVIAYLRKGTALFYLEKYSEAKEAFSAGLALKSDDDNFKTWIRKCEAELDLLQQESEQSSEIQTGTSGDSTSSQTKNTAESAEAASKPVHTSTESNVQKQQPIPLPTGPKTRYDWYQTETHVVIEIMLKKVNKNDCKVDICEQSLSATVKLPTGTDYSLELDLAHKVVPEKSLYKVMSTKIEIKLRKLEAVRWSSLEGDASVEPTVKQFTPEHTEDTVHKYPTSSHYTRNWDHIVTEIKEEEKNEKLEGDAALNQLFQQIYGDGSDETKKAMMKSFYESGGTVLSTNWNEVGGKKVDVKPPDGMEYKKWNE